VRVGRGVHVAQRGQDLDAQTGVAQPAQLDPAGVGRGHRDSEYEFFGPRGGVVAAVDSERPEPAVVGRSEHGLRLAVQQAQGLVEQGGIDLRGVHADQQGRTRVAAGRGGERGRDARVEAAAGLRRDADALADARFRQPGARLAVEEEEQVVRRAGARGVQRVGERGLGQPGGLVRGERRAQPGLDPSGHRCLRQDDQGAHRVASFQTRVMSRTALTVPDTVPVTFDFPVRGA
jgi:hypothetical protein